MGYKRGLYRVSSEACCLPTSCEAPDPSTYSELIVAFANARLMREANHAQQPTLTAFAMGPG